MEKPPKRILITGGSGYLGSQLVNYLVRQTDEPLKLLSVDVRALPEHLKQKAVTYIVADVSDPALGEVIGQFKPEVIVHLAAIVMPAKPVSRELMYKVDVEGTKNVLQACLKHGVKRFITTSSGAAYGYYADNAAWLKETDPIRGNYEFAYAYHKRLVEELLAEYREKHPALEQTILRVGTILGDRTQNQITSLFEKEKILGLKGYDSPFVVIWDQDLLRLLSHSVFSEKTGIYNVAGDGALSISEIAHLQNKKLSLLPSWLVKVALGIAKPLGLSQFGPEQVRFIQYRPVLANDKLKNEFGFIPEKSSKEAFLYYLAHRTHRQDARPQLRPEDLKIPS